MARFLLMVAAAATLQAQTWDTSGNKLLNGEYYFRQVYYVIGDQYGDLVEAIAVYGNINFHGDGTYSITATEQAQASVYRYDYQTYAGSCATALTTGVCPFTTTGTYSIAASGYGFISSPYASGDQIYGLVSAQGVFVGSSTDNATNGYNDLMVAAPVTTPRPTNSSFTGSWQCADFDLSSGSPGTALSMMFPFTPDGNGHLGNVVTSGYYGNGGATAISQNYGALTYAFSNGAAVAVFPNSSAAYIGGQKYLYFSSDGNFLFGGSPNSFDFIVGVKTSAGTPALSGFYYQAGLDEVGGYLDTYYGSFYFTGSSAPQNYLGHQRLNYFSNSSVSDYTYNDTLSLTNGTASDQYARYVVGDGGAVEITAGTGPYLGLSVALRAPNPTGSGVYISPIGVENSASGAPFTARIAPGELLTIYGAGLAASTVIGQSPFLLTLNHVQVTIGGLPAPIYYVSAGQLAVVVPYGVSGTSAAIQVNNNGALSNIVYAWVGTTSPGVFTQNANGTGYGAIVHLGYGNSSAAPGTVVSDASPALEGETLAVFLTGLGAVSPTITDGAAGGTGSNLNNATSTFAFNFAGGPATAPTPSFAGLAPGVSGQYQMNITIPSSGLTAGPNFLSIYGPDSSTSYLLVPISTSTASSAAEPAIRSAPLKWKKPQPPIKTKFPGPVGK